MAIPNEAFTTGSVATFNGASGLLQTLLDFVCGTVVTGAATSGSGAGPYIATLTTPVGLGRATINYAFSSVQYTAVDDGAGNITGTNISSASINHSTGAFTVTFTGTPDASPTVDYLHGQPGQDWKLMYQRNTRDNGGAGYTEPFGSDCFECVIHNTGLSGAENVLLGFREWYYTPSVAYGWDLTGYTSYVADQRWELALEDQGDDTYDPTWEHWSDCPVVPMIDDTMYYWFYSNQQRITGAIKIQSNYESFYVGFAHRYGNPNDYQYPLAIIGAGYGQVTTNTANGQSHAYVPYSSISGGQKMDNVLPDNSWSLNSGTGSSAYAAWLWPYAQFQINKTLYETPGKKSVLMSPIICYKVESQYTLWELDGVYHVAGVGVQSEDIIRAYDGKKYRVFQNVAEVEWYQFMAIEEDVYTSTTTSSTSSTTTQTTV
jgi:hypothetical protein